MTDTRGSGGALAGVRVVDLSRVLAGPYCAQLLGDHGADVVKVEPPVGDLTRTWGPSRADGVSAYYAGLNRNKRHLVADLTRSEGRDLVLGLLADADVVVENFKPGTLERWGLAADDLMASLPRLVWCRVTAFGADDPLAGQPGYDAVIQAHAGLMHLNGDPQGPPTRWPVPIADLTTALHAFSGVLLALQERERSGRGQMVEISLYDAALSLLHPAAASYFMTGVPPSRLGSAHPDIAPCETFRSPLGELYVAAGSDRQFSVLVDVLGAPALAADPRFATNADRLRHRHELNAELAGLIGRLDPSTDIATELIARGVPASLVRPVEAVLAALELAERGMVAELDGLRMLGIPVHLSRTPGSIRTPPRAVGADVPREATPA
ncbi:CoA transferase [Nocardioides panacihumi]|uniref:CoA transferase n=1 Tax=Nocardioides panacihumi TaxID=400774 RepID=A0ABN2QBY7_9ACTN